jgi:hypothetical protein
VRSPRDQPGGAKQQQAREAARATPAKQAPAEQPSDESGQAQQAQQEQQAQQAQLQLHGAAASLAKSQAEVATLRRQLREAGAYVARMEKVRAPGAHSLSLLARPHARRVMLCRCCCAVFVLVMWEASWSCSPLGPCEVVTSTHTAHTPPCP